MHGRLRNQLPRVGVIGFGAISRLLVEKLTLSDAIATLAAVLVRPERVDHVRSELPVGIAIVSDVEKLVPFGLDLVAECAGQQAVIQYSAAVLRSVSDLAVISTGALVDDAFRGILASVARDAQRRVIMPAGAIAGIDGLSALRLGGLDRVRYVSAKPPAAWIGTSAETRFNLGSLAERTVIFHGPAREAARLYPRNANLAATVALAGLGLDRTEVVLVADPALRGNSGRIEAEGLHGSLCVEVHGPADPQNAKTSSITGFSILHAIENLDRAIVL